jgi:transcriptional regulator with XRE-family HTH domain
MPLAVAVQPELGAPPPPKLAIKESDLAIAFGRRVFLRRTALNMSQEAMIRQLNYINDGDHRRSSASVWENGHAIPSVWTVYGLARVLKSRPDYLAFGTLVFDSEGTPPAPVPKSADIGPMLNGHGKMANGKMLNENRSDLTIPSPHYNRRKGRSRR